MRALLLIPFLLLGACGSKEKKPTLPPPPTTLEGALSSHYRSSENIPRDQFRHPLETLNFFGIQPNMTVIEIAPGAGWYAQILAPYLNTQGKYIAAAVPVSIYGGGQKFLDWLALHPEIKDKVTVNDFNLPAPIAEPGSADMVLTFRNVHNWMSNGQEKAAFKSFFEALKPGGILGVVEHRAAANKKQDPKAKSGYVTEKKVIELATKAGFKLVEKSEINANPKDTKDHPDGVWSLPPVLRGGDATKDKFLAIGESDRMTLKFIKPAKK